MSTRDIADFLKKLYGTESSRSTVSRITDMSYIDDNGEYAVDQFDNL